MNNRIIGLHNLLLVFAVSFISIKTIDSAYSQEIRWLRVGQLQSFIVDYGAENELAPIDHNSFSWPAQYGDNQYTSRSKTLWMGATNFYDPVEKRNKTVKVIGTGPLYDNVNQPGMIFPQSIKLIARSLPPEVRVDNQPGSVNAAYDTPDEIDPSLPCDRMVVITFNTSIGVSVTKKVMAFTQQNHENYFIYDYVIKNTGIYNEAGDIYSQTLNNFWVHFGYRYGFAGVTSTGWGSTWGAFSSEWGASTNMADFGPFRNPTPDTLRGFYAYYSPNKDRMSMGLASYDQDWGCPNQLGGGTGLNGLLGSAKYAGAVTLFASTSPQNYSLDNTTQPSTTSWFNSDDPGVELTPYSQYDEVLMQKRYTVMTEGHLAQSMEEAVGSQFVQDFWQANQGGRYGGMQGQGYGPYTLASGDSINIVFAEGTSGISWEKCREVGAVWYEYFKGTSTPPLDFPTGKTGTTYTDYAKAWVQSGKDSLLQTFSNARNNFRSGYSVPQPPPAPQQFKVSSGGDQIYLTWSDNATSASHFDGYVIYRSEGTIKDYHTVYSKVFECNAAGVVHEWYDTTALAGIDYYYYIQSKDDGTQNELHPGTPLFSSMFLTMTSTPVGLNKYQADDFRSRQSGNWNDTNTWERLDGSKWDSPAPSIPSSANGSISILQGHIVTVTSSDSADQVTIFPDAELIIQPSVDFHITNGDSTDLQVYGTITNFGTITQDSSASLEFNDESRYTHKQNGGSIPLATWNSRSTCEITNISDTAPSNLNQHFDNLTWNCHSQADNFTLNMASCNTLVVLNTNWNHESPQNPTHYLGLYNTDGNYSIGQIDIQGSSSAVVEQTGNYNDTIWIGPISISNGGLLLLSNNTDGTLVNCLWNSFASPDSGYFGTTNTNNNSTVIFTSNLNTYNVPPSNFTYLGGTHYQMANSSILKLGSSVISGSGSFTAAAGATIETTHPSGINGSIQVSGTISLADNTNYTFDGTSSQVTGSFLPDSVGNLIMNNSSGLTLSNNVVINGNLDLQNGTLISGGHSLTYGTNGSLIYGGDSLVQTSDFEFPYSQGPRNLLVHNSKGIILHGTRVLNGYTELYGRLYLGANSLTTASATSYDTTSYVVTNGSGILKLSSVKTTTLLPVGTSDAYTPIWIANSGTADTITAHVTDDITKPIGGGRVNVKWEIREGTSGGGNYTVKLGWMNRLEDSTFQSSVTSTWRIYRLPEATPIATSGYVRSTMTGGRTIQHASITTLTDFTVGNFTSLTDIEDYNLDIPLVFNLKQNYPNPFNPSTTISFDIPSKSLVTLKIYDLLGREVTTLASEIFSAGRFTRVWNAGGCASGIYFYRIQAGSFTETKKLVLLK